MANGPNNQEIIHPAAWRLGPNPRLASFIWIATVVEAVVLFLRKPLDPLQHDFLIGAILFGLLFFWVTVAWISWFTYKTVMRLPRNTVHRKLALTATIGVAIILGFIYLACWGSFLYTGIFPDAEMLGFLASGSASELDFILFVIEQTIPHATIISLGFAGFIAVALPIGAHFLNSSHWQPRRLHGEGIAKLLMWIIPGLMCLFLIGMAMGDADIHKRKEAILRLKTQVNPALSIVASLIDQTTREPIQKEIDLRLLAPLQNTPAPTSEEINSLANRPNVFFLAVESLRSDMIGKEHQGRLVMPHMTDLATKSLVFSNAHAQATHTDYAITSFLSSQYPMRSLRHYHPSLDAPYPKTMIYDWLKDYGYSTAIITSDNTDWCEMANFMVSDKLDVFFDSRNMPSTYTARLKGYSGKNEPPPGTRGATLIDEHAVDYATAWLADNFSKQNPVFLHLMFQQTHFAYVMPNDYPTPFQPAKMDFPASFDGYPHDKVDVVRNAYYNAAYNVDIQLGRLLQFLEDSGQMENSIIVFIGDHGEGFFEHNLVTHSRLPYEEFSRIPMIVYLPPSLASEHGAPGTVDYPTEQIDMAPTVAGLLGLPAPMEFQGIDVLSPGRPALENRYTFSHVEAPGQASGECVIQAGRWKYMKDRLTGLDYLFDLQTDPGEKIDRKASDPQIAARLRNKLKLWRDSHLTYYKYNMYFEHYYPPDMNALAAQ